MRKPDGIVFLFDILNYLEKLCFNFAQANCQQFVKDLKVTSQNRRVAQNKTPNWRLIRVTFSYSPFSWVSFVESWEGQRQMALWLRPTTITKATKPLLDGQNSLRRLSDCSSEKRASCLARNFFYFHFHFHLARKTIKNMKKGRPKKMPCNGNTFHVGATFVFFHGFFFAIFSITFGARTTREPKPKWCAYQSWLS